MNCQIFETVVNDLARDQMMEANTRELALAHSGECEGCALRLALERRLTSGLRALAAEMKCVSASDRVEERLLEAFHSQPASFAKSRPVSQRRYWLWAAAAAVLLAFGIAAMRWQADGPSQAVIKSGHSSEAQASPSASVDAENPITKVTPLQSGAFYPPGRKHAIRRSAKRSSSDNRTLVAKGPPGETNTTEAGNSESTEVTTQFLPLSYVGPANLQDGGQLVRVELPRSAMVRFGLPVNMERYGERVKADVLVSADGLARAIRFVQ
jgi:hypothetical protein